MATLADLPLGARILIPVGAEKNYSYEIADISNLVSGGTVLVLGEVYSVNNQEIVRFGSSNSYPNSDLDNYFKTTIYNKLPQGLRDMMMDTTFDLSDSGQITRKVFALTYTMVGFGENNGTAEGKALQLYTNDAARKGDRTN